MREVISVRVVRLQEEEDQFGGAYQKEVDVPGSPFTCWLYRRAPRYQRLAEDAQGPVTTDEARILSFRDVRAAQALRVNDIALIPPCVHNAQQAERVTLQHCRPYSASAQWDIQSGATPSRADSDTEATDYNG